jgi:hypothetical protein
MYLVPGNAHPAGTGIDSLAATGAGVTWRAVAGLFVTRAVHATHAVHAVRGRRATVDE